MNQVQVFQNPLLGNLRTIIIDGKEFFYGIDIATTLMYKRPRKAVNDNCKGVLTQDDLKNSRGYLELLIPEGDVYRLIIKAGQQVNSQEIKERAERLEKWIFDDILPTLRKSGSYQLPQTTDGKIALLAQGHVELKEEINSVREDLEALKMDLPVLPIEADKITTAAKKRGVDVMGGKSSPAYNDRGTRQRVYNSIYANLKYNFGVRSYKSIKRCQVDKAIEIINQYQPPFFLKEQINGLNAQQTLKF